MATEEVDEFTAVLRGLDPGRASIKGCTIAGQFASVACWADKPGILAIAEGSHDLDALRGFRGDGEEGGLQGEVGGAGLSCTGLLGAGMRGVQGCEFGGETLGVGEEGLTGEVGGFVSFLMTARLSTQGGRRATLPAGRNTGRPPISVAMVVDLLSFNCKFTSLRKPQVQLAMARWIDGCDLSEGEATKRKRRKPCLHTWQRL